MGMRKDRNGMDLTEEEDIKSRWQEYTEELYKKDLHDPDNHDGEITHLEPDILECEVKWALESITTNKASQVMEFLTIWNSWAISNPKRWGYASAALNMQANFENSAMTAGLQNFEFHFNPKEEQCQTMSTNYQTIPFISYTSF